LHVYAASVVQLNFVLPVLARHGHCRLPSQGARRHFIWKTSIR